jgi:hypothetical protein
MNSQLERTEKAIITRLVSAQGKNRMSRISHPLPPAENNRSATLVDLLHKIRSSYHADTSSVLDEKLLLDPQVV